MEVDVSELPGIEVKVGRVRVSGLSHTKSDIVVEQTKDVLSAKTLSELLIRSSEAAERLNDLDVFKSVTIVLDTVKPRTGGKRGRDVGGASEEEEERLEVNFFVKEKRRVSASIGAEAGTQSGEANASAFLRNVLGRAEKLQVGSSTSFPHWGHTLQLQFTKPYYKDLSKKLLLSLGTTDNKVPSSGYQEHVTGGAAELQFLSDLGKHQLSLGYDCRQLYGFTYNVPMEIREEAGHSIKSYIKHVLDWDERDDPLFPRSGCRVKLTNEVTGLGGDVHFTKMDMLSECHFPIYRDWVLSLSLWGGYLHPFTPSKISDRFLLGGPSTLRGFKMWGVGPQKHSYSLGGDMYWASGVHLLTPLPLVPNTGLFSRIRCHAFATSGNLLRTAGFSLRSLAGSARLSCGVGLHFRLGVAQIELNYAVPIKAHPNDQVQPGLKFGIGLDML